MSQRNPNNDRYKDGGKKGVTRKMSGRAKPKSTAGSSVYTAGKDSKSKAKAKEKEKSKSSKGLSKEEKKIVEAGNEAMAEYNRYRNIWIGMIVISIIGILVSFLSSRLMKEGAALASLVAYQGPAQIAGLVTGYAGLVAAFVIDWKKMRPVRKAQGVIRRKESKKERAHREAAEAEKAANKKSFFGRKKD